MGTWGFMLLSFSTFIHSEIFHNFKKISQVFSRRAGPQAWGLRAFAGTEACGGFFMAFSVPPNVLISKGAPLVLWPPLWGGSKGGPGGAQGSHFSDTSAAEDSPTHLPGGCWALGGPEAALQVWTLPWEASVSALCPFVGLEVKLPPSLCVLSTANTPLFKHLNSLRFWCWDLARKSCLH